MMKPGITTKEINTFVEAYLEQHGATSEQKGYNGYPYAICASVNDEMCHAFPADVPLTEGDIVTIDTVVNLNGVFQILLGRIELEKFLMKQKSCC